MTKKTFIALADEIRHYNSWHDYKFSDLQIEILARFFKRQNSNFNHQRWVDYINGKCGPSGGAIKNAT